MTTSLLIRPADVKVCFKCQRAKDRSEFYRHPMMDDGLLGKCKDCTKQDVKERYNKLRVVPAFLESERFRGRDKYRRLYAPGKPGHRKAPRLGQNWKSPPATKSQKMKARNAVSRAVASGKLKRSSRCEDCGTNPMRIHGHHEDYQRPLAVTWLCSTCHRRRHAVCPERVKPSPGRAA